MVNQSHHLVGTGITRMVTRFTVTISNFFLLWGTSTILYSRSATEVRTAFTTFVGYQDRGTFTKASEVNTIKSGSVGNLTNLVGRVSTVISRRLGTQVIMTANIVIK